MTPPAAFDLLTIGHSNQPRRPLHRHCCGAPGSPPSRTCARCRSRAASHGSPARHLAERLAREGIAYLALGDTLGGRPRDPELYCDGVADYEAMAAAPEFRAGLDRVADAMARHRLCLMCAEREPLDCHRCLLLGRRLAERGLVAGSYPGRRHDRAARRDRGAPARSGEREGQGGRSFPGSERRVSPTPIAAAPAPSRRGSRLERRPKICLLHAFDATIRHGLTGGMTWRGSTDHDEGWMLAR